MSLAIEKYKVSIRLVEDMLGTVPKDKKIYETYIASLAANEAAKLEKAGVKNQSAPRWAGGNEVGEEEGQTATTAVIEEEVGTVPEAADENQKREEKGWTGFHCDDKGPFIYNYAVKGFLCEAARTLKEWGSGEKKLKQLQDKFKRYVFVAERRIYLGALTGEVNERPLRELSAPVS